MANLEEQLAQVKDELRSSKEVIQEQTSTIQSLSGEGGSLKVLGHLYLAKFSQLSFNHLTYYNQIVRNV